MEVSDPARPVSGSGTQAAWARIQRPWRAWRRKPLLSRLIPRQDIVVMHADGRETVWRGDAGLPVDGVEPSAVAFVAVEIPAQQTLERRLALPPITDDEREAMLALDVRAHSPFAADEVVWGWRDAGSEAVLLLTSRQVVQLAFERAAAAPGARQRAGTPYTPEAWAFDSEGRPVVLRGFAERKRQQREARGLLLAGMFVALALLLLVAGLVTPTLQLWARANQASQALATAERELAPVIAQRQQFAELTDVYAALREQVQTRIEPLGVLDLLTELIPDDSWLQRLQVRGAQLTLVGQTTNTTALMNRLSEHPMVRDVRAPSAATRVSGGRENFIIELTLLPQALRADAAGAAAAGQSASVRISRSDGSDPAAASASASASVAVSASNPSAPVPAGAAPQASAVGGGAP